MSTISFLIDAVGQKTHAVVPIDEFERMTSVLEDRADSADAERILRQIADGGETVPAAVAHRLIDENPVRVWREYRGLTQRDLAARANLSEAYVSQIESGVRKGSTATMIALANALSLELEDLV